MPGSDNLQRLIQVLLAEHLLFVGEEQSETRFLWETVSQAYDERPGTYRLYPPFDEHWFSRLLQVPAPATAVEQETHQELSLEESSARERDNTTKHVVPTNLRAQPTQQLDGIPLALELAAARLNLLSLEQIAERLADRFHLLTTGRRTALPRHQTLRATLDWSYALLSKKEQLLFNRLSVFAGGCSLAAIEAICARNVATTSRE